MSAMKRILRLSSFAAVLGCAACVDVAEWAEETNVLLRPDGDLLVADAEVDLAEDVDGDAMTAGAEVLFDGTVGGSYLGIGGVQAVRGRVEGSVRAAASAVRIGAAVGRNVTAAGREVELGRGATVEHNAYLAGGRVVVEGVVERHLYVGAAEVVLDGIVGGDVRIEAAELRLGPNARVQGDLRYRVEGARFTMDPVALVEGETVALTPREDSGGDIPFRIVRLLAFVFAGAVLVALLPGTTARATGEADRRPGAAIGLGLLWLLVVPIALVAISVTIVGLPLAAVGFAAYFVSLYLAPIVAAFWLGSELLPALGASEPQGPVTKFLVGGPLLAIAVLLPGIGFLVRLLAVALGLGAIWMLVSSEWRKRGAGSEPTTA
jgi:hypothetical protein